MTSSFHFRASRQIGACFAIATLVAVTAAVAMGLANSEPVSSGMLGPDWQCTRLAFAFTSCTPVARFKIAAAKGNASSCPRSWRSALGLLRR